MANAYRDQNNVPTLIAVSSVDGVTPVRLYADPTTHRLLIDTTGGAGQVITPTGTVDGLNNIFTVPVGTSIVSVVVDGLERYSGFGYTYSGTTVTVDPLAPPVEYIRVVTATVTSAGQVNSIVAGTNVTVDSSDPANPIVSATGGSATGYQSPSGTVNGSNTVFVFSTAPNAIVVDGVPMQKTQSDSTANWTGTTTITLSVAPNFDIFGIA